MYNSIKLSCCSFSVTKRFNLIFHLFFSDYEFKEDAEKEIINYGKID